MLLSVPKALSAEYFAGRQLIATESASQDTWREVVQAALLISVVNGYCIGARGGRGCVGDVERVMSAVGVAVLRDRNWSQYAKYATLVLALSNSAVSAALPLTSPARQIPC